MLVGLPGSGKSTWLEQHGCAALASDHLRWLLADDPRDQSIHRPTFAALRYLLRARLELRRPATYIDATNLTVRERRPYITTADLYDAVAEALFFDVPLQICRERNERRARTVPDDVMLQMAARLTPPALSEGFARIEVIRP